VKEMTKIIIQQMNSCKEYIGSLPDKKSAAFLSKLEEGEESEDESCEDL